MCTLTGPSSASGSAISLSPCLLICKMGTINGSMPQRLTKTIYIKWKWKSLSRVWLFADYGLYSPWNSPGQNTAVDSLFLLQGILPTQGSNPGPPHCRWILYQLSHKGSPVYIKHLANSRQAFNKSYFQDFPVVQWLRLHIYTAGGMGSISIRELGSHMPCGMVKKKKNF